jgi:hypothetical protein
MRRIFLSYLFILLSLVGWNSPSFAQESSGGSTSFRFLNSNYHGERFPEEKIIQTVRENFDVSSYREVRIAVMNHPGGLPYIILQMLSRDYHRFDVARMDLDGKFDVKSVMKNYKMNPEDYENQFKVNEGPSPSAYHLRLSRLECPDNTVTFVTFAPNKTYPLEQSITQDVSRAAADRGLKVAEMLTNDATHDNFIAYLKCPNLKGVFYDGDADPNSVLTFDVPVPVTEITQLLNFRKRVTHIWVACEAFKDPMLSAMTADTKAQKYAAGKNCLKIGPSDRAAACAMKAALRGRPMTAAFWRCYKAEDTQADIWGFAGRGSDLFGHAPTKRKGRIVRSFRRDHLSIVKSRTRGAAPRGPSGRPLPPGPFGSVREHAGDAAEPRAAVVQTARRTEKIALRGAAIA